MPNFPKSGETKEQARPNNDDDEEEQSNTKTEKLNGTVRIAMPTPAPIHFLYRVVSLLNVQYSTDLRFLVLIRNELHCARGDPSIPCRFRGRFMRLVPRAYAVFTQWASTNIHHSRPARRARQGRAAHGRAGRDERGRLDNNRQTNSEGVSLSALNLLAQTSLDDGLACG